MQREGEVGGDASEDRSTRALIGFEEARVGERTLFDEVVELPRTLRVRTSGGRDTVEMNIELFVTNEGQRERGDKLSMTSDEGEKGKSLVERRSRFWANFDDMLFRRLRHRAG